MVAAGVGFGEGQQEVITTTLYLQLLVHFLAGAVPAQADAAVGVRAGGDQEVLSATATSARLQRCKSGERGGGGRQEPGSLRSGGVQGRQRQEGHRRHKARRNRVGGGGGRPAAAVAGRARQASGRGGGGDGAGPHGWLIWPGCQGKNDDDAAITS